MLITIILQAALLFKTHPFIPPRYTKISVQLALLIFKPVQLLDQRLRVSPQFFGGGIDLLHLPDCIFNADTSAYPAHCPQQNKTPAFVGVLLL
jgi:hypothetical protein